MKETQREVLRFVEENDVKFIRLAFVDIMGTQKNLSIMPCELEKAFSEGIPFNASKFTGFFYKKAYLKPIASSLSLFPWRPQTGRVIRLFCDITDESGKSAAFDSRMILEKTVLKGKAKGYEFIVGSECEFYLFKNDEQGNPTDEPIDHGSYFDMAPLDQGENIRRDICLTLEKMSIQPESSHHEEGWGQNEIVFAKNEPLTACDNFITYKGVVATMAHLSGNTASFDPLPMKNQPGSGLHFKLSIYKDNEELTEDHPLMMQFMERIKDHLAEICPLLNITEESYERLGRLDKDKLVYLDENQLFINLADSMCNPYLALACILEAGMDESKLHFEKLPENRKKARSILENSAFIHSFLDERIIKVYTE